MTTLRRRHPSMAALAALYMALPNPAFFAAIDELLMIDDVCCLPAAALLLVCRPQHYWATAATLDRGVGHDGRHWLPAGRSMNAVMPTAALLCRPQH